MVKEATGLSPTIVSSNSTAGSGQAPKEPTPNEAPNGAPAKASDTVAMLQQQVLKVQHQAEAMDIDGDAGRPPVSS